MADESPTGERALLPTGGIPSIFGEQPRSNTETPDQESAPQKQPTVSLVKFKKTRWDTTPASVKETERGFAASYKSYMSCTDEEKSAFLGFESDVADTMLKTLWAAYHGHGPQSQIDQPSEASTSSYQSNTAPEPPLHEKMPKLDILLRKLHAASPAPGFDIFYAIAVEMENLGGFNEEYKSMEAFNEAVSRAWEVIEDIDPNSYLKKLQSALGHLEKNHTEVITYWRTSDPAEILNRVQQNAIQYPHITGRQHGMIRHLRECYDVEQLYDAAQREWDNCSVLLSKATAMSYEELTAKWRRVWEMKHPGESILRAAPGQMVEFTKRYYSEALRQGESWMSWYRMYGCGILLLFLVAQYDEGFVQNEGDWTVSWGLDIRADQINWIGVYLQTYMPQFTAAAAFLAPWTLRLYEKGWVSREERVEIIKGLKNLGFGNE